MQLRSAGAPYSQAVHALRKQFNQCKVAKELGVHRNTIKRILNELGIDRNEFRALNGERIRFPFRSRRIRCGLCGFPVLVHTDAPVFKSDLLLLISPQS